MFAQAQCYLEPSPGTTNEQTADDYDDDRQCTRIVNLRNNQSEPSYHGSRRIQQQLQEEDVHCAKSAQEQHEGGEYIAK